MLPKQNILVLTKGQGGKKNIKGQYQDRNRFIIKIMDLQQAIFALFALPLFLSLLLFFNKWIQENRKGRGF